jgi:glycosyltransferase involved in cell wall biosynthesis
MKIWILQTGEQVHIDQNNLRPTRAINLADSLIEQGNEVVLWTSDFDHFTKKHRYRSQKIIQFSNSLQIRFIPSRGYSTHHGLARLTDHIQLGWNLSKMLNGQLPPDVAIIGYPTIETAWVMSKWLDRKSVPFIVDVKDTWPENLVDLFPKSVKNVAQLLLRPYFKMMKSIFGKASGISTITQEFMVWCLAIANREQNRNDFILPLTSQDEIIDKSDSLSAAQFWDSLGVTSNPKLNVYFVGTINEVFNFSPLIYAARNSNIKFIIAGDGPLRNSLMRESIDFPNIIYPGWISSVQQIELANRSILAIAPWHSRKDFEMSIPNKLIDALRLSKPMLISISGVPGKLLESNGAGLVYSHSPESSLLEQLTILLENPDKLVAMSKKARELYESEFSYKKAYGAFVEHVNFMQRQIDNE